MSSSVSQSLFIFPVLDFCHCLFSSVFQLPVKITRASSARFWLQVHSKSHCRCDRIVTDQPIFTRVSPGNSLRPMADPVPDHVPSFLSNVLFEDYYDDHDVGHDFTGMHSIPPWIHGIV